MSFGPPPRPTSVATSIDLHTVHTWYDERGQADLLVLLHGGRTDSRRFGGNFDVLAVVPSTSHLLLFEKRECTCLVEEFLTGKPELTMLPIRRANSRAA